MGVVHIGAEYFITHPNYTKSTLTIGRVFDIGLIKTWSESKLDQRDKDLHSCVYRPRIFRLINERMAMVAGWSEAPRERDLQIGSILIEKREYLH